VRLGAQPFLLFPFVAGMDGLVQVFDAATGKLAHKLEGPNEVMWMRWHGKGHVLAAGSEDGTCWLWNAAKGDCMQVFSGHVGPVLSGTFSPSGRHLVTGGEDGAVAVWRPSDGKSEFRLEGKDFHDGPVVKLAAHHDPARPLMLTGSQDTTVCLVNLDTKKILHKIEAHTDSVEGVGFCRTHHWCATASVDGKMIVWDLNTMASRVTCSHDDAITHLQWHPTEPLVFTSSMDKTIRVWDARTGKNVREFKGHKEAVLSFALSNDGKTVYSASDDSASFVFAME